MANKLLEAAINVCLSGRVCVSVCECLLQYVISFIDRCLFYIESTNIHIYTHVQLVDFKWPMENLGHAIKMELK